MSEKKTTDITVLHLLLFGNLGGIENLCRDIGKYSKCRNIFCFSETGNPIAKQMKKNGNRVYILKRRGFLSYLQYPMLVRQICLKEHADLVVTHHENPWIWLAAILVKKRLGIPVLVYVHCEYKDAVKSQKHLGQIKEKLYQRLLKVSDHIICISRFVARSVAEAVPAEKNKICLVYNGIPLQKYHASLTERRHEPGYTELIFVGRLIPEKGVSILLDAFHSLRKDQPNLHLTIVGYGPEEERLKEKAKRNKDEKNVSFTGRQENVVSFLKKADIFIHPAVWNEGFGLTLVEAMSAGVIPVAVEHGSVPELIKDGEEGFLVKHADKEEIAEGIKRALTIIGTGRELQIRQNAEKKAEHFSIESTAARLDAVFLKTLHDDRSDQY